MRTAMRAGVVGGITAAALVLAACSGGSTGGADGTSADAENDVITVAYADGGTSIDPPATYGGTGLSILLYSYDMLVDYKTENGEFVDGEYVPSVATSWETSEDGLTWTFQLRDDVVFHSGNPLTAADVEYSFDRGVEATLWNVANYDDTEVIDDHAVAVHLVEPNPSLLGYLAQSGFAIIDKVEAEKAGDADAQAAFLATNSIGSGPYILDSWDSSTEAKLHVNPDYWGEVPTIENVTMRFIPELSTQIQQLKSDDVQLIYGVPFQNIDDLKATDSLVVEEYPSATSNFMAMNNTSDVFDDARVRRALAYATPYDDIIDAVLMGHGVRDQSPLSPLTPGYDVSVSPYEYDLDTAREILAESDLPDGFEFSALVSNANTLGGQAALLMQESYAEIGVRMNIETVTAAQLTEQRPTADANFGAWLSYVNHPFYHLGFLIESSSYTNYAKYSNPEVDQLIAEGEFLSFPEANETWSEVQALIAEDSPWITLYSENASVAYSDRIDGYVTGYVDQLIRIQDLSYAE
ncbi:ABC transporter substrate-binding protein [Microbacterium paludicola]|uniref:ABC transporter substrate-binding protein n=1 Tax=Microbacterium paludicola TaxID=300019 RepID=A0A4Y9FU01_9MICO|nr:ABC transporter substrate-binding protein [Microbacterium paludicola]MBF0816582.1 ABC transporter substrate-binding protein [Microbacterium paludicola]TFU32772.1 ABC transporter substrate-binding protein [Microbacterium paludicola]